MDTSDHSEKTIPGQNSSYFLDQVTRVIIASHQRPSGLR